MSKTERPKARRVPRRQDLTLTCENCEAVGSAYFIAELFEGSRPVLLSLVMLQEPVACESGVIGAVYELVIARDSWFEVFRVGNGPVLCNRKFPVNVDGRGVLQGCLPAGRVSDMSDSSVAGQSEDRAGISLRALANESKTFEYSMRVYGYAPRLLAPMLECGEAFDYLLSDVPFLL